MLNKPDVGTLTLSTMQLLRAIEVLEYIGTPDARLCLEWLAAGAPEAWVTRAAKSAVAISRPGERATSLTELEYPAVER